MALGPGSITFVGINTAGGPDDWIAFATLDTIPGGTTIYFTDNELTSASATTFNTGESYTKWVAPAAGVAAGTIVTLTTFDTTPAASVGTASVVTFSGSSNRGLSTTADSVYAYLADSDATANTPTAHLAYINIGNAVDGTAPSALAANEDVSFTSGADSAIYSGPHSGEVNFSDYLNLISNTANWTTPSPNGATSSSSLNTTPFTLTDTTPPALSSSTPADNATGLSPSANIVLTFNEAVQAGTGNITITDNGGDVRTIAITDSSQVSFSGATVTINPTADLHSATTYDVVIPSGAITDIAGNAFAGIAPDALDFTTAGSTIVAPISLASLGTAYTQNFDTLSNTAGSTTNNLTIPGWALTEAGGGARDNEQYAVDTGASNTGDTYSYGAAGSTDRALGGLQSGTLIPTFGAFFVNDTGSTITSLDVAYGGEEWRLGTAGRTDQIHFQYSLDSTDLVNGTWVDWNPLDFTTPDTVTTGAKNGNAAPDHADISSTISGLSIAPGATFAIHWTDVNASGADDGLAVDDFSLTPNAAAVPTVSIADASISEGNSGTKVLTFTVTRSDTTTAFTVDYATANGTANGGSDFDAKSGTLSFAAGGPATQQISITINGDTDAEPNETFTVNLGNIQNTTGATTISDNSATGTILNDDVTITPIYTIQGTGHTSPLAGTTVTTQGVVIAVDTTSGGESSRGFYIQDPTGDGNASTSDAIFVFVPTGALPTPGHLVQVTGTVQEFTPSGADPGSFSSTELSSVTNVTDLGVGPAITPVQIGGSGGLIPPTSDLVAGSLFYEGLEDMLVTVKAPIAVGPTNSFGEIFTVVDNDNDPSNGIGGATGLTPHGNLLLTPGQVAFGDSDTVGGDFNPERVQIDADTGIQTAAGNMSGFVKPEVNVGAHLSDVTGVVTYAFANYQVLATQPYTVTQASTLVKETGTLTGDSNHLVIASYNAENIDPKVEDINKVQGHSSSNVDDDVGSGKFDTIAAQIFNTLHAPDVLAMQEIQDEDGAEISSDTSAAGTLQLLVGKINALAAAAGSPAHYSFVDNPFINNNADGTANGGQPGGNIRTAFIYRDDRVSLEPGSLKTLAADGTPISDQGSAAADAAANSDQVTNPNNPFFESRPPLIATFDFNGQKIIVVDNHFTSKGGSAALLGSDQPPFDAGEVTRAAQAQAVNNFVDSVLSANPNAKIVIAGDLNEFQFEEPLNVLKGTASVSNYNVPGSDPITATATYTPGGTAVLTDLQDVLPPNERYDYVFEGNSETLDHMLVSNSLAGTTQFDIVHLNAEFADQTSDHEPLTASVYIAPVVSGQQSFTLPAGGVLSAPSGPAIIWDLAPPTTGTNATVDNGGAISAASGRAIDTTGASNGNNHFTLINHAGASITSPDDAIRINADLPNGVVMIDNLGSIRSTTNGQALDFNNIVAGTASTTITNETGGVIAAAGADAIRPGTNATINNHGQITGAGSGSNDGIDFQDVGFGSIHNFQDGSITGARHGITGKLPISVDNDAGASILGQHGSGINLDTASDTTTVVNNSGTITGTAGGTQDGDGIDVDGLITLNNHGLVEGLGTWTGGLSEAVTIGGGTINNFVDGVIHSVQRAITVDDSNLGNAFAPTVIYNEGTVKGDSGEAISITDVFADTLTNKGTILGTVALGDGNDVLEDYAGATFSADVNGGAGSDTINLRGTGQGNLGSFSAFETVNVFSGDWTIASEGFAVANLETGAQTLRLAASTLADGHFNATISGFGGDDLVDLEGIGTATHATLGAGNILTVTGGSIGPVTLQLDPARDYTHQVFTVAADGSGGTLLTVGPGDLAPVFTSPESFSVPENQTAVGTVAATDPEHDAFTFTLAGGADEEFFVIDAHTGALRFVHSPDFETPQDANHDNVYDLTVAATDVLGASASQTIHVSVNNLAEIGQVLNGGNGNDNLTGTTGNDTINGGNGNDIVDGGDGNDNISGGNGNDIVIGGRGDDILDGGNGDDSLDGGLGNDHLAGGNGNDNLNAGDGNNVLDGGSGNDVLTAGAGNDNLSGGDGNDNLNAGEGNNMLDGGNGNDVLIAGAGNDNLSGGDGNDYLNAGEGNNVLDGGNGNDVLLAGAGNDNLSGGDGNDSLNAGDGNNVLDGGNGNDVLTAGAGNDSLNGGSGNDTLFAGGGDDVVTGGNGSDLLVFASGFGHDVVTDFTHGDHIEFDGGVFQNFQAVQAASHQAGNDTVITLDAGNSILLQHVTPNSLHASDFLFA